MRRRRVVPAFLSFMTLGACGDGEPGRPSGVSAVRDSLGIRVVEVDPGAATPEEWVTTGPPVLLSGEAPFFGISHVLRLSVSEILVADGDTRIRVLDRTGVERRAFGGRGEGPGEFRGVNSMRIVGPDQVAVFDARAQRISLLDAGGRVVSIKRAPVPRADWSFLLRDGGLITANTEVPGVFSVGYSRLSMNFALTRGSERTVWPAKIPGPGWEFATRDGSVAPCPFLHRAIVAASDSLVVAAWGLGRGLGVFSLDGELLTILRWPDEARRLPDADAWTRANEEWAFHMGPRGLDSYDRDRCSERSKPPIADLLLDSEGLIWVGRDAPWAFSESRDWEVYSQTGEWLAWLSMPYHFSVSEVRRTELLGVVVDSLGRESPAVLGYAREMR